MKPLLILTCGTGTAGKYSNLAAGLVSAVRLHDPERYWLVPSSHPDSIGIADLVREEIGEAAEFVPWTGASEAVPYCTIDTPDDVVACRAALDAVIGCAKDSRRSGQRVVVNPTSGTKQMTAGATLAALDREVEELAFTVGERHSGVVMTGTERLSNVDTRRFMFERTLREAERLFSAGACHAAARLLEPYPDLARAEIDTALCLHFWQHLHYQSARKLAANSNAPALVRLRKHLEKLCEETSDGEARVADMLAGAERLRAWHLTDEALVRYYHCVEAAARARLSLQHSLREPFELDAVLAVPGVPPDLAKRLRANARDGRVFLTLALLFEVLEAHGDSLADAYLGDGDFRALLNLRNAYMHDGTPADPKAVEALREKAYRFIEQAFPGLTSRLPAGLWPRTIGRGPA